MAKKDSRFEQQQTLTFRYHEQLEAIVKDLEWLDKWIPRESCRTGLFEKDQECRALIEARKNELLGYIQTICRDHVRYSKVILKKGWYLPEQPKNRKSKGATP